MDALLLVDTTGDVFPTPAPALVDLINRARGVGGVIVHVAAWAVEERTTSDESGPVADGEVGDQVPPQIDSVLGTRDDELVLVSAVSDAFEGVEDLAEGLDDLGVGRIILAGSNARGAVTESAYAALAIGFELVIVSDGIDDPTVDAAESDANVAPAVVQPDWKQTAEAAGATFRAATGVWLKM